MERKTEKIKYLLYARKSSEENDRQIASIDSQIDELTSLAKQQGLFILDTIVEAQSAKQPGRPQFNEMLRRIREGEANGILCWKVDRLSRNPIDTGQVQWLLQRGVIQHILTYTNNYYPTDNVIVMGVELGQANQLVLDLSVNVKRGQRKRVGDGFTTGVAPSGYVNAVDIEKGARIVIKDPDRFDLIRKMWELKLTGHYSVKQILKISAEDWGYRTIKRRNTGGKPLSYSGLYQIFRNPFYYGEFEYHKGSGDWKKGSYEPMVTKEEFDRVQFLLSGKVKPRPKNREFAFTGLISCGECKAQVTAEVKNQIICTQCKHKFGYENKAECPKCEISLKDMENPVVLNYVYYHCTKQKKGVKCSQKTIRLEALEQSIKDFLGRVHIKQEYLNWALEYLKKNNKKDAEEAQLITLTQQEALKQSTAKLERLLEMRLNNEIDKEQFLVKKEQLIHDKEKYIRYIKNADSGQNARVEKAEKFFEFCHYALYWFEDAKKNNDLRKQKEILAYLGSNLTLIDRKLHITPLEPFTILENALHGNMQRSSTFEPKEIVLDKRKSTSTEDARFLWLGRKDSNLRPID